MGILVQLDQSEIALLMKIGEMRNKTTSKHSPDMAQDKTQNSVQMSIQGTIGEYAVAKRLNLHFDMNTAYRNFGADLISHRNAKIDVKSTTKAGGNMNAVGWTKPEDADVYILTEVEIPFVNIVGWIKSTDFIKEENIVYPPEKRPFYTISQNRLNSFTPPQEQSK